MNAAVFAERAAQELTDMMVGLLAAADYSESRMLSRKTQRLVESMILNRQRLVFLLSCINLGAEEEREA